MAQLWPKLLRSSSAQHSGFPGLTRQCGHRCSSPDSSLVKPHEASTGQALEPTPTQDQRQEPTHCSNGPSTLFITVRRGRGLLGEISAVDWWITALAPPMPDLLDDSCPVGCSTTAHDGPFVINMGGGSRRINARGRTLETLHCL